MGFSLRDLGKNLWELITPQDEDAQRQAEANLRRANQRVAKARGFRYGALARPQARQQFVRQNQAPDSFDLGRNALSSFADSLTKPSSWQQAPHANVGDFFGSGYIEDLINSPFKVGQGLTEIGQGDIKQGIGDTVTGLIEGPAGFIPITKAAQLAKGAGVLPKVVSGAKVGFKEGAPFGAAYGGGEALRQDANAKDTIKATLAGGALGGAGGAVLGGGAPVAVAGAKLGVKGLKKASVKLADNTTPLIANEAGSIASPSGARPNTLPIDRFTGTTGVSLKPTNKIFAGNELENPRSLGYDGNAITRRTAQIKAGERPPVTVAMNGNQFTVIEGNHTLEAYRQLGIKDIPIVDKTGGKLKPPNPVAQVGKNLNKPKNADMFSKKNIAKYEKMNAEDLASLSSKEQMALHELQGYGPPSKIQVATGLKKNPYKSNIHEVAANNWTGARTAGDAVSAPIQTTGRIADYHLGRLAKDNPKLYGKFWDSVEKGAVPKDAPPSFRAAAKWFRETANGIHKESNILGTPTRYQKNWELRAANLKDVTPEQLGSGELGSLAKHAIKRKYSTHAEFVKAAEKAGLTVEKDPRVALRKYVAATGSALQRKAVAKSLAEADRNNLTKPHTVDLGWGTTVKLSDEGLHQAKGILPMNPKKTKFGTLYDATNSFRKGLLLSVSQFHTVNIAGLRAAPALLMPKPGYLLKGDLTAGAHPIRAGRGLYGVARATLPKGKKYVINKLEDAYTRGDVQFAARHGSPFGKSSYGASKHFNIGHKTVFEKQLPMMHKEVTGALRRDLKKFGIKEGSPEALEAGKVANFTMGFINRAAMNMSPTLVKAIERTMLAGQFTPSKLANLYKGTTKGGLAGSMARADVVANAITAGAIIVGVGWLVRQKSDNIRDAVLKALINPAIPTPFKDKKGNTQEIRIPMTYTSEVAHILGIKLVRQKDGHLGVSFNPKKFFSSDSPAAEWARARLSPNLSTIVKVKTNTEFGNKPLYQEGASHAKQAIQVATKEAQGALPIGLQGLGYTEAVKNLLPGSSKEVLEAGTPSSNPLIKSLASSTGFSVRTDRTTGKSLESGRYFDAKDKAKESLKNAQSKAAFELYTGSKKDPVTGKYNVQPTVWDTIAKAAAINQNPQAFSALVEMNKKVADAGGKVDPLWLEPKQNIKKYFQYQAISDPNSNQRTVWYDKNKKWYQPLSEKRGKFFDSLPPSDPNKPSAPIEYPQPSKSVQAQKEKYFSIKDSKKRFDYIDNHPSLENQMDKEFKYKNDLLKARGYAKYKAYPKATPQLQKWIDNYIGASKSSRKGLRNANPQMYQNMAAYFDSSNLYGIGKQASVSQLQGQPDYTSDELKKISNLARDIYQNPDGTYTIIPAGWMSGGGGSGGGYGKSKGGYGRSGGRRGQSAGSDYEYAISLTAGGSVAKPKVSVRKTGGVKSRAKSKAGGAPKVTLKASKV